MLYSLREYLPLEQGLRLNDGFFLLVVDLREYLPLEQGLRLENAHVIRAHKALREYLPLEQGLRLV